MTVQILAIVLWTAVSMISFLIIVINYEYIHEFNLINTLVILDVISIDSNFVSFIIMGLILYRSAQVADGKQPSTLKSSPLLKYLKSNKNLMVPETEEISKRASSMDSNESHKNSNS